MKLAIIMSLVFGSLAVLAADVHGICMTAMMPSTTFEMKTEANKVQFEITNHNGGTYAPFWSSLVVPSDIFMLSEKANTILKLDRGFKASWPADHCQWAGENKFSCMGSDEKINVNGVTVEPFALYSSVITDSSFAGDFKFIEMTVSFRADQKNFNYTMRYSVDECILSEKPLDELNAKRIKILK